MMNGIRCSIDSGHLNPAGASLLQRNRASLHIRLLVNLIFYMHYSVSLPMFRPTYVSAFNVVTGKSNALHY